MLRKLFRTMILAATIGLPISGAASAGNPHGVVLTAPKTVTVNYTACADGNGNPLPCLTPVFTVTNNSSAAMSCEVTVPELNGMVVFNNIVDAGTSGGGSFTTPYVAGTKSLTLVLSCNGSGVPGETQKVRVLVG